MKKVKIYFDGNKTPDGVTCSYVLIDVENTVSKQTGSFGQKEETIKLPQETTVPQAEYQGLIHSLKDCTLKSSQQNIELEIYGDSELIIKQIQGVYECKKPHLRILRSEARNSLNKFASWQIRWVPRKENKAR